MAEGKSCSSVCNCASAIKNKLEKLTNMFEGWLDHQTARETGKGHSEGKKERGKGRTFAQPLMRTKDLMILCS